MKRFQSTSFVCRALTGAFAALLPAVLFAQPYPAKPIRVIAPFAAGGGVDFVARIMAQKISGVLGQSVIVDNRPGAGGNIGTEVVAKSAPDGYTLLAVSNSFTVNPSLYRKVPYDPIKDFEPISGLTSYMLFLVCHPSFPVRSVKALIALAKAQPGKLNYASAGAGTTTHIGAELFNYMAGVKLNHIPFKGTGPVSPAVIGGEVELTFGSSVIVPHIKSGRVVLLGVTGATRSRTFPDTPTIAESGLPGYEATGWNALFAPSGTPSAIVKRLSEAVVQGLGQKDAMEAFQKQDLQQTAGSPAQLASQVKAEVTKWAEVIRAAGIQQQ